MSALAAMLVCWLPELPIYAEAALDWQLPHPDTLPLFARSVKVEPGTVQFPPIRWDGDRADCMGYSPSSHVQEY